MVYDCVLFNDELHLLELRLAYLYDAVDKFVIGESASTFSGQSKPLYYLDNALRFSKYFDKIVHLEIPAVPGNDSWKVEFYQRNYLKEALKDCADSDLVIIADVDEIPNMDQLGHTGQLTRPCLIHMPLYYYFFNLKTAIYWCRTLVTPYKYIRELNIGDRLKYDELDPLVLTGNGKAMGWHFSYLFGRDLELYQSKLKSFAHQELNTPYYLDQRRIKTCLALGVDFLERYSIYEAVDIQKEFPPALYAAMQKALPLAEYIYQKPGIAFYLNPYHLKYYLKFVLKLKLRIFFDRLFKSK